MSFVAPLEHPRRRVEADSLARHARHNERDAPPVRRCPAGMRCPVGQDHVTPRRAVLERCSLIEIQDEREKAAYHKHYRD